MSTIASLNVDLALNSAKFVEGLRQARKAHEDFSKSLSEIGERAGSFAEVLGVHVEASFSISGMVEKAKEAEATQAKLNAVLRATGEVAGISIEGMERISAELSRLTTFSREAVSGAETVLATFTHVRGDQFREAIKAAADLSTIFGIDLTTAAEKLGRALENPAEGLKSLAKMGVQFSAEQREVIDHLVALGDTAGAQEKILEAVNNKVGGSAAAAAKTAGGALKQLQNTFDETAAHIGKVILPAVTALAKGLNTVESAANTAASAVKGFQQIQGSLRSLDAFNVGGKLATAGGGLQAAGSAAAPIAAGLALLVTAVEAFGHAYETSQIIAAKAADREAEAQGRATQAANRHAAALEALRAAAKSAADQEHEYVQSLLKESESTGPLWQRQAQQADRMHVEIDRRVKAGEPMNQADEAGNPIGLARVINDWKDLLARSAAERTRELAEEAQQRRADLERQATMMRESLMTPFERFQQTVGNLKNLLAADLLNPTEYVRGLSKAESELQRSTVQQPVAAAALAEGSAAAYSAALHNQRAGDDKGPMFDLASKALTEAKEHNTNLQDIKKALLNMKMPTEQNM